MDMAEAGAVVGAVDMAGDKKNRKDVKMVGVST